MKLQVPDIIIEIIGNIKFHKYPLWVIYKPKQHKITPEAIEAILENNIIEPGDIILRRFDGYLSNLGIPGFWKHIAIAISDTHIIHSTKEGVNQEHIIKFMRCDYMCILRPLIPYKEKKQAVAMAIRLIGKPYDYDFDLSNDKYYCTELIDKCFNGMFKNYYTNYLGIMVLKPDVIFERRGILLKQITDKNAIIRL